MRGLDRAHIDSDFEGACGTIIPGDSGIEYSQFFAVQPRTLHIRQRVQIWSGSRLTLEKLVALGVVSVVRVGWCC